MKGYQDYPLIRKENGAKGEPQGKMVIRVSLVKEENLDLQVGSALQESLQLVKDFIWLFTASPLAYLIAQWT